MATIAGIPLPIARPPVGYVPLRDPAPIYRGGPEGRVATLHFLVGINHVTQFVQYIIGTTETISLPGGTTGTRVVPLIYPDDNEMLLFSYEVVYRGKPLSLSAPGPGQSYLMNLYDHAIISCEFRTLPFNIGGDAAYYSLATETGAVIETIPDSGLVFSDGEFTTGDYGLPIPITAYRLTTFMSPTPVSYAIASLSGKVSSLAFTTPTTSFPAGTLRFDGVASEYQRGMFSQSLTKAFSIKFREPGWNFVMKRNGVWSEPTYPGTGLKKYQVADLNQLKSQ